jgi:hypothetical protein
MGLVFYLELGLRTFFLMIAAMIDGELLTEELVLPHFWEVVPYEKEP